MEMKNALRDTDHDDPNGAKFAHKHTHTHTHIHTHTHTHTANTSYIYNSIVHHTYITA